MGGVAAPPVEIAVAAEVPAALEHAAQPEAEIALARVAVVEAEPGVGEEPGSVVLAHAHAEVGLSQIAPGARLSLDVPRCAPFGPVLRRGAPNPPPSGQTV